MTTLILKLADADNKSIRGTMLQDGSQVFSVYDFIHKTCAYKDQGACARKQFQRLVSDSSEFKDEIISLCQNHRIPGSRGLETPTMTLRGLQRLLLILGSKVAAEFRALVEGTFTRVMAGDTSLIQVIEGNAASNAPINKAYRAALEKEPVDPVLDEMCKKRKLEHEETLFELEVAERKMRIDEGKQRMKTQALENTETLIGILTSLRPDKPLDERTKLQIEDQAKNILLTGDNNMITNGTSQGISVSMLAVAMGYNCTDAQRTEIGKITAKKYRDKYNDEPPKHPQYVKGNVIQVNSYTERDRGMMEAAIKEYMENKKAK